MPNGYWMNAINGNTLTGASANPSDGSPAQR